MGEGLVLRDCRGDASGSKTTIVDGGCGGFRERGVIPNVVKPLRKY
jgi:hypothetical protein